jgi:hypothetical protein
MAALRSEVLAAIANCPLADNRFPVAASPQSDARRGWAATPCAIMPAFGGTGVARSRVHSGTPSVRACIEQIANSGAPPSRWPSVDRSPAMCCSVGEVGGAVLCALCRPPVTGARDPVVARSGTPAGEPAQRADRRLGQACWWRLSLRAGGSGHVGLPPDAGEGAFAATMQRWTGHSSSESCGHWIVCRTIVRARLSSSTPSSISASFALASSRYPGVVVPSASTRGRSRRR